LWQTAAPWQVCFVVRDNHELTTHDCATDSPYTRRASLASDGWRCDVRPLSCVHVGSNMVRYHGNASPRDDCRFIWLQLTSCRPSLPWVKRGYTAQCEMTDFLYVQNGTFMTRLRCQLRIQLYHTRPSRYKRLYWSHSHGEIQQPLTAGQCGMAGIDTTAATRPGDNATVRWSVVQ